MTTRAVYRCAQGSDMWNVLHIGKPSAGNFNKILTAGGRKSAQRKDYMYRLIAEVLLKEHLPLKPTTEERESKMYWLDRGIDMEPIARKAFEQEHDIEFESVGFVERNGWGCSPDGLVAGKNEAIELKAPAPWTQMKYLLAKADDPEGPWKDYKPQVQGQILVGEFDCIHFYAYHPRMPRKYVLTLPDSSYMATLRQALDDFSGELKDAIQKARELGRYITAEDMAQID